MNTNMVGPGASNGNGRQPNSSQNNALPMPGQSSGALFKLPADQALAELLFALTRKDAIHMAVIVEGRRYSRTFMFPRDLDAYRTFYAEWNGKAGLYYCPNPVNGDLIGTETAAGDTDVAERRVLFFDHDVPDNCSDVAAWQQTIVALHEPYGPAELVDTGSGGVHVYYLLRQPASLGHGLTKLINAACAAIGSDRMGNPAHLARLPYSTNVPDKKKVARGRVPGIAHRILRNPNPTIWDATDLCRRIVADHNGSAPPPPKRTKRKKTTLIEPPPNPDPAPSIDAVREVLAAMPNDDRQENDREHWVDVAHGIKGSSIGTAFESDARDLFSAWSAPHPKNDPQENERLWNSIHSPYAGFGWLLNVVLARRNPSVARDLKRKYGFDDNLSVAEEALARLRESGWTFFHTPERAPYAAFNGSVFSLNGAQAWSEISAFLHRTGKVPAQAGKSSLRDLMVAEALNGAREPVFHRVASAVDGRMHFVNLMDDAGGAIQWGAKGWDVVSKVTLPMRLADRPGGLPLPRPQRPTDGVALFDRLRRYAPIPKVKSRKPSDRGVRAEAGLLMLMVSQFRCDGTLPHAAIVGPKGSAKTSTCKRLKDLTDPDAVEASQAPPRAPADLYTIVAEQRCVAFDNISKVDDELADALCALASGTGYQARSLYTNFDRAVLKAKCSVLMNSTRVDFLNRRPDLVDRTVIVELDAMRSKARRSESELNAMWEADRALLLGQLLDALVGALTHEPGVTRAAERRSTPRLRDAALLAECAARALGWRKWLCLDALVSAWQGANERALSQDPVAAGICELVPVGQRWAGTTADLLAGLVAQRNASAPADWGPPLPHNPRGLTNAVHEIRGQLLDAYGIQIERGKSTSRGDELVITRPK